MKKLMIILVLAGSLHIAQAGQASAESVKALLETMNAGQTAVQAMDQVMSSMKAMLPDAPAEFWEDIKKEAKPEKFVELIAPVYQKNLSQEDVEALAAFYKTPAGQNFIKAQPQIIQQSMAAGQQWGQELAQQILAKYNKKYKK